MIYKEKKIIVAPLNWGLGHSTRCIPIINSLIDNGYTPLIASDGTALKLLRKEFPRLKSYDLPPYNIRYSKKGSLLKYQLLIDSFKIIKSVKRENSIIDRIVDRENVIGIISDNRFGVRSNKVPSVYITHQINVLSGQTTVLTSRLHQMLISKFDACWIPDFENESSLGGELSHIKTSKLDMSYIGFLSRFSYEKRIKKWDLIVLLSGPEPQRTIFEKQLLDGLKSYKKKTLFVRGLLSEKPLDHDMKHVHVVNYMLQKELQKSINESEIILARSGYSTIMDLEKLNARAFFVPTPGQYEQEYLAQNLENKKIAPFTNQKDFNFKCLSSCEEYQGFKSKNDQKKVHLNDLYKKIFN